MRRSYGVATGREKAALDQLTSGRVVSEGMYLQLVELLDEFGADADIVRERAHLGSLTDESMHTHVHALSTDALHAFNSQAIWVIANIANGQDGRPGLSAQEWRMMFYCLTGSRSLREVITRAADFYQMLENRWGRLTLHVSRATAELRFHSLRVRKNAVAFVADTMGITAMHGLLGWLIGETIPLSMISLDYPAAFRRYFFHKALPYPLHLDADRSAICFAAQYLDFPVIRSTHDSGYKLIMSFAPELEDQGSSANLAERVRRLMYQMLRDSHRVPSLQALSDRLSQTRATLRRQLKQSGVSYNQLKDSCRRELSLDLLRRSQLSIEDIANQLGFCDADAFRRSFRGWIGISPSNYRQQGQARAD